MILELSMLCKDQDYDEKSRAAPETPKGVVKGKLE
jgi:hypothetical protein